MTDENDYVAETDDEAERLQGIAEHVVTISNLAQTEVPNGFDVSRELVTFWGVHSDEHGNMEPPQDPMNIQFTGAIFKLEAKIAQLELRLRRAGL